MEGHIPYRYSSREESHGNARRIFLNMGKQELSGPDAALRVTTNTAEGLAAVHALAAVNDDELLRVP